MCVHMMTGFKAKPISFHILHNRLCVSHETTEEHQRKTKLRVGITNKRKQKRNLKIMHHAPNTGQCHKATVSGDTNEVFSGVPLHGTSGIYPSTALSIAVHSCCPENQHVIPKIRQIPSWSQQQTQCMSFLQCSSSAPTHNTR